MRLYNICITGGDGEIGNENDRTFACIYTRTTPLAAISSRRLIVGVRVSDECHPQRVCLHTP